MTNNNSKVDYATIDYEHMQTFETVEDMNAATYIYNKHLTKKEYQLFNYLSQSAYYYPIGITLRKHKTIAYNIGVSVSTVKRTLKNLVAKGVLIAEHSHRPKRREYGANLYIIPGMKYFKRQYKRYLKHKHDLAKMTYLSDDIKTAESQRTQAIEYVRLKKSSINLISILNNKSTNRRKKSQTINNNIPRVCPPNISIYLYQMMKPFLTDGQIEQLYRTLTNKIKFFKSEDVQYYANEIIERAIKTLLTAMRDAKVGRRSKVYNPAAYATSTLFYLAMKVETFIDLDNWMDPIEHDGYNSLFA